MSPKPVSVLDFNSKLSNLFLKFHNGIHTVDLGNAISAFGIDSR